MKKPLLLALSLAPFFALPAFAQTAVDVTRLQIAPKLAEKSVFAQGFKEPQGLVLLPDGRVVVTDYKGGEVIRLDKDGKNPVVLAKGLKSPAQIIAQQIPLSENKTTTVFALAERKANRVVLLDETGAITPMPGEVAEPLGIADARGQLVVVSHTSSKLFKNGQLFYSAPQEAGEDRYGFRFLAADGDTLFMTDETDGAVWMISPRGQVAKFASGLGDPSGLAFGKDGALYVCDEGDGGRLWKLNSEGVGTVVAQGLGRPRGLAFVDAKTVLVANRDGNVWRVVLP